MLSSVLSLGRRRFLPIIGLMEKQSFANSKKSNGSRKKVRTSVSSVNISTDQSTSKKKGRRRKKQKNGNDLSSSLAKLNLGSKKDSPKNSSPQEKRNTPVKKRVYSSHSARVSRKLLTLEDLAHLISIGPVKNVVVMAGAGISTRSGIPDFRTPGTGLYDNLKKYKLPNPTAVFDLNYFHSNPKPFYELAKELYPSGKYQPNFAHYFIRCLHEKGILLRAYTQNIDGLERLAGIPPSKLVEAHGTFSLASCTNCGKKYDGEYIKSKIFRGVIPRCEFTPLCFGIVKPDIVFFGEDLPKRFYYYLKDFPVCDLLLVMGTSLEVEPFASLVDSVRINTPRVLFNRDRVGPFKKCKRGLDLAVTGDITDTLQRLSSILKWTSFIKEIQSKEPDPKSSSPPKRSDTKADDSGVSSSSSVASDHKEPLPPLKPDMKRFFHTLRSTPLPKKHPGLSATSDIALGSNSRSGDNIDQNNSGASYYDYIRKSLAPASTKITPKHFLNLYNKKPPVIHYAVTRTPKSKALNRSKSCVTVPCSSNIDSDSQSDTSESTSSESSGS